MSRTGAATPHDVLVDALLDPRIPKREIEHAAAREITDLRAENAWLRKALEGVLPYVRVPHDNEVCGCDDCNEVRSAIAAAREATK